MSQAHIFLIPPSSPVPDPYFALSVGSDLRIKFSDYGLVLAREDVVQVLELATSSALSHDADTVIGTVPLISRLRDVTLILITRNDTRWRMWTTALREMRRAVRGRGIFFEWSFDLAEVRLPEEGEIGYGRLNALPNSQDE
jgi:hypothetical protein